MYNPKGTNVGSRIHPYWGEYEENVEKGMEATYKPKLKHFLWKCLHNWLATRCTMVRIGMKVDEMCKRCGMKKETREQLFFHCHESALIWKLELVSWDGF